MNPESTNIQDLHGADHHRKNLSIRLSIVYTHDIEIALDKFPVATFLRLLATKHLGDMVSFEWQFDFAPVCTDESGKRNSKVEPQGNLSPSIVGEMKNLLIGLSTAFAKQHFGVFEYWCIYWHKSIAFKCILQLLFKKLSLYFLIWK